ncbi:MAG: phosphoribosylglycinamide formyltransferase [Rhodospirillaceae bacterium]|jgi:phosphoribosylglycinamide formyltransferase 1|nr:phosphoribosylglycinamide formyltransferase [Rhodospirillaceae bacterium]MBT4588613.1 phosphoribosylglycinamide formyltransferase [Rhodospirillaceae bacterium]MBT5941814.1 phosphoribosylglycinamide formyltransferase [Rhodospirillaceae bacterium]MBT7266282.1 phosphoribosylglycinamide formyltransferase [Rhodospirillaceae bacterium]
MSDKLKLGVLISGRGSNLQSLIDATQDPNFPAEIVTVITNVPDVAGLDRATKANIPTTVINHKDFDGRAPFEDALHAALQEAGVELVCLAGFMRLLTDGFVNRWLDRMINIHPSLLPSFKGLHTHERAIKAGVRFSGCTIHFVRPEMDDGPIIAQAAVPIRQDDTADSLAARVLVEEHKIYPLAVRLIAENRVSIENSCVKIEGASHSEQALINPN